MAAQELINILERTVTGSQADLENARNFLAKAAEQNLVCPDKFFLVFRFAFISSIILA